METKILKCSICKNMVMTLNDSQSKIICCGHEMKELIPGSVDASVEKHVPKYSVNGNKVTVNVGSVLHPMLDEHYIEWVMLETQNAKLIKYLKPGQDPIVNFTLEDNDVVISIYAYCNLHGLWKK